MNMQTITEPGVYESLSVDVYHGNCTPEPALSAGFAARMVNVHPARAWYDSPLRPDYEPKQKKAFDIGRAAHLLFLEPEHFDERVVIIRCDDYRTNAAREQRDAAYLAGKTPLLAHEAAAVAGMRRAMHNGFEDLPFMTAPPFAEGGFQGGQSELSYFWQSDGGIWMKCRPDYRKSNIPGSPTVIIDYKTAAQTDENGLGRAASNLSWDIRAATYIEGHKALTGKDAEYWYVVQSKDAPYFVEVVQLDGDSLEWGREQLRAAKALFLKCLRTGKWPANNERAKIVGLPAYAQMRLQDRKDRGDFDTKELYDVARRMQAPLSQLTE